MNPTLRLLICAIAASALVARAAVADVPTYENYELQARTNLIVNDNGYNLPPGASFNSVTVDMNDDAEVTFRVAVVPGFDGYQVWFGSHGSGSLICQSANNTEVIISDPTINATGDIGYSQFGGDPTDGIYHCDAATGATRVSAQPIGASSWGTPILNDAGLYGYRAGFGSGSAWVSLQGTAAAFHATEVAIDVGSPYDFLFTPSFNNARQIAGVVSYANTGFAHREVRRFESDGTSISIADDADGTPSSPYTSFDNSVALNDAGQVAFIAALVGGGKALVRSDGTTSTEIARAGVGPIASFEAFGPAINADGLVAFRAVDAGGQAIYVGDGTTLRRVVGKGDAMPSDLGTAQIGQNDSSPVFGGGVAINAAGDVAFTAALHPPGNNQVEWGTGVYVAYANGPPTPPDPIFSDGYE